MANCNFKRGSRKLGSRENFEKGDYGLDTLIETTVNRVMFNKLI